MLLPAALKNLLGQRLAAVQAQHPERTLEVWFQDEARFGQQGLQQPRLGSTGQPPARAAPDRVRVALPLWCGLSSQRTKQCLDHAGGQRANPASPARRAQPKPAADCHMPLILDGAGWLRVRRCAYPTTSRCCTCRPMPRNSTRSNWWARNAPALPQQQGLCRPARTRPGARGCLRRLSDDPERLRQLTNFDWIQQALDSYNQGQNQGPDTF